MPSRWPLVREVLWLLFYVAVGGFAVVVFLRAFIPAAWLTLERLAHDWAAWVLGG